ncbi:GFA family protein [uncultured Celeribacter sp.]|uniref:GFA family protein n=1 Tax=uncultured Celeribacter sp. TaxID=1303376 RepID=UPI002AA6D73C|nr:GFA family protein [uncultured Celeribacter sp.]
MITGQCECGKVAFELPEVRDSVTVCHCSQCRRISGHLWASTHAPYDSLSFTCDDGLTWYASSEFAKRGFCCHCGSSLFYQMNGEDGVGIAAGCLDRPTGLHIGKHIFLKDKGDYYDRPSDAPLIESY